MRFSTLLVLWLLGINTIFGQHENISYQWFTPEDFALADIDPDLVVSNRRPTNRRRIDYESYLPDTVHSKSTPRKYVRLAIHYMNTADTFFTEYEGQKGIEFARSMVYYMNTHLENNGPYLLDPDLHVYNPIWRYGLARKPGSEDFAVYHHYSDSDYDYLHGGPHVNRSRRNVNKYAEGLDSLLHIFIMAPPRDSMTSPTFTPDGPVGIWNGRVIKVTGYYPKREAWAYRQNLNHEVGHAFGLPHAWLRNDGCDDTVAHPNNCWNEEDRRPGCDTLLSNNMMDYNSYQQTLTPCQIGRVNGAMSRIGSRQRAWVDPIWCDYYDGYVTRITHSVEWKGGRDLWGDLVVTSGYTLKINGRVHLPSKAKIRLEPGAVLELGPNAWLHNDCGQDWLGIELGSSGSTIAEIHTEPGARIENIALHE